ncbi:MAG: acetyl-CoA carboxylase biotin carboxyl carrier protein [Kouleothrix sp.]
MTEASGDQQPGSIGDDFGLSALREVLRLISETDITEITIERGGSKLHIRRGHTPAHHTAPLLVTPSLAAALPQHLHSPLPPVAPFHQHAGAPGGEPVAGSAEQASDLPAGTAIVAPMVGTFYNAPSPKDQPYVHEGDIIQPGDRVGIVEAMKMMNEIEAEIGGRIVKLLVKNGQPVEYGQPLMIVEPI